MKWMRWTWIGSISLGLLVATVTAVTAQDSATISPGVPVQGEITDEEAGSSYTFEAAAGDVVVIQMQGGMDNGLMGGEIRIENSRGAVVADSGAMMVFGRSGVLMAAELGSAGTYTLTVYGGTGTFTLLLLQAVMLEPDTTQTGTVAPPADRSQANYGAAFAASSSSDYTVNFTLTGGSYLPSLAAYSIWDGGNLFPIAAVVNLENQGRGQASSWRGGGIEIAGSRELTIFLIGSLERMFGSPDTDAIPATFEVRMELQNRGE